MIEIKHLSKTFQMKDGAVNALKDISLTIPDGSIYGIIGMSGAGKSTLVRCINLLERPTEGSVVIDGVEMEKLTPAQLRQRRREITMIFQQFNLLMQRSCLKNICFPMELAGVKKEEAEKRAKELLEMVGLPDKANAYPAQLSGGQKQRIAIARALATNPKVLLCDEATSALDPQTTNSILRLLKQLNQQLGLTVVVITHEMAVVKEICNRVAVMEHGKVAEEGEVFSIFAAPKQPITQSFIKTTSNLQKIEELIAADSPVTRLNPGELIVRLSYVQRNVSEPLISSITERFHVSVNIIFADIEIVQDAPIGGTVAIMGGKREQITQAIEYLIEKNVGVEVIRDARAAE